MAPHPGFNHMLLHTLSTSNLFVGKRAKELANLKHVVDLIDNSTWELTAGREIIHEQGDSPDAQHVIIKLKEIDAKSVSAGNVRYHDNLLKHQIRRSPGQGKHEGLPHSCTWFIRQYNDLIEVPADRLSNNMQSTHMKIAVNNCPELQSVSLIQDAVRRTESRNQMHIQTVLSGPHPCC
jgi:hypothetical protein